MVLEGISAKLSEFGISVDLVKIKRIYSTNTELEQLEDQLLRLLRSIEAHSRIKSMMDDDTDDKKTH